LSEKTIIFLIYLVSTTFGTIASESLNDFDTFVECCFGLEIIFAFFSAYKDEETMEIVSDVFQISKKYLK